jgi:hypothetical protein
MEAGQRDDAWLQTRLAFEDDPLNAVVVSANLMKPHRLVASAVKEVRAQRAALERSRERLANPRQLKQGERWEPDWEALAGPSWSEYERRGRIMDLGANSLPLRVSLESADRALRIWDAMLKACEARRIKVSLKSRLVELSIDGDTLGLRLSEKVDRIECKKVSLADDRFTRLPTGKLRFFIVDHGETRFEDTVAYPIESQLNDILRRVYRTIAAWRAQEPARAKASEAARLQMEERRRQQEAQAAVAVAKKQETERERQLVGEATAWREAQAIREYALHIEAAAKTRVTPIGPELQRWIVWADSIAEKLDPTSNRLGIDSE